MTEESSEPKEDFHAWCEGEDELRFDLTWNEELWIYLCENEAAEMDMRFDIQWIGSMHVFLDDGRYGRLVIDGQW